jgi:hypothetical protein
MALTTLSDNSQKSIKSFWERPEGTTGMITLALLGVGGFFLAKALLPSIIAVFGMAITAVGQAITITILCAVLAALLLILTNPRFQAFCSYLFKSTMRAMTSVLVEIDPIGIMKGYIDTLRQKKKKLDENKSSLKGQIRACDEQINANSAEINKATNLARAAEQQGNRGQLVVHGRNIERLSALNERMKGTRAKMEMLYQMLVKYSDATDLVIQDMCNDVKAREQEMKYSRTANSAMRSAMAILKGEGADRELYDEAMEYALNDYANKMGEIEDFMESTRTIMDGIDLQNGVWEQAAIEKLNQFENKTDSLLLGGSKRIMIEDMSTGTTVQLNSKVPVTSDYNRFFKS